MKLIVLIVLLFGLGLPGGVFAQGKFSASSAGRLAAADGQPPSSPPPPADNHDGPSRGRYAMLPVMSPELALSTYERRTAEQAAELAAYSAVTVIRAELPETAQQGEFELQRRFEAPHTLQFTPLHFTGDGFVKTNVITRLLQSEVDHVQKDDPAQTAISRANYKFSYKGVSWNGDRLVHIFQVKPHRKRLGLFKGRVYLDARNGTLLRAEGSVVKSPSFFVKHIEFLQEYAEVLSFTLPVHVHSEAKARIVGKTIVDITHRDYRPVPAGASQSVRQVPAM
jgi:hypothetical protein